MTAKRAEDNSSDAVPENSAEGTEAQGKRKRRGRVITAKDAGWITPTCFVLPLKLIPVDPPRPIKKAPPQAG